MNNLKLTVHVMGGAQLVDYSRKRDADGEIGGVTGHSRSRDSALHPKRIFR